MHSAHIYILYQKNDYRLYIQCKYAESAMVYTNNYIMQMWADMCKYEQIVP